MEIIDLKAKTEESESKEKNEIAQNLLFKGDISGLTADKKWQYYQFICHRLGLDPLSQPFQIIRFAAQGGKEVLYCTKGGCEQLSDKKGVSHLILEEKTENDLYIVKARATLPNGRFVEDIGVVDIQSKKGNDLANLKMKAVTKAKRRATLSLLGLGMLDETEIETISNVKVVNIGEIEKESDLKPAPTGNSNICADCGKEVISAKVIEYSNQGFGTTVCFTCQGLRKNKEEKSIEKPQNGQMDFTNIDFSELSEGFETIDKD